MSAPNPLSVMQAAVESRGSPMEMAEARAAVAELVEADREYDAAMDAFTGTNGEESTRAWNRLVPAKKRRDAALAKFGEG